MIRPTLPILVALATAFICPAVRGQFTVDVRTLGAVGDGTTDDTNAFQNAINTAVAVKGTVFVPATAASYLVGSLVANGPLQLRGEGAGSRLQHAVSLTASTLLTITLAPGQDARLESVVFDGAGTNPQQNAANTLCRVNASSSAAAPTRFDARNCTFLDQAYSSLFFSGDNAPAARELFFVQSCNFVGGRDGTSSSAPRYVNVRDGGHLSVSESTFDSGRHFGDPSLAVGISAVISSNSAPGGIGERNELTVVGCRFANTGRVASDSLGAIDFYARCGGVTISQCMFLNSVACAVRGKSDSYAVTIASNTIVDTAGIGIYVTPAYLGGQPANGSQYSIVDNHVRNVSSLGTNSYGIIVTGNTQAYVLNCTVARNTVSNVAGYGIYCDVCQDLALTGNIIELTTQAGIQAMNAAGEVRACDNTILSSASAGMAIVGLSQTSASMIVARNAVRQATGFPILCQNARHVILECNSTRQTNSGAGASAYTVSSVPYALVTGNFNDGSVPDLLLVGVSNSKIVSNSWNP